jgi:hypothetical protein
VKVAEAYGRFLSVYDLDTQELRSYTPTGEVVNFAKYMPTNKVKGHKALVFAYANGHIYPYTPRHQRAILTAKNNTEKNILHEKSSKKFKQRDFRGKLIATDDNKVPPLSHINAMSEGKVKTAKLKRYNELKEEYGNYKFYEEGTFDVTLWDFNIKYHYVEDNDLSDIVLAFYDMDGSVYQVTSCNGIIKEIFSTYYDKELKAYVLDWKIKSTPNYKVVKSTMETMGMIYSGEDINIVGRRIYERVFDNKIEDLQSQTLGEVFTPEFAFNATTTIAEGIQEDCGYNNKVVEGYNINRYDNIVKSIMINSDITRLASADLHITKEELMKELEDIDTKEREQREAVSLAELGEVITIDIRKCYSNMLEEPYHAFAKYELFDNIENSDGIDFLEMKEKTGWWYVEEIVEDEDNVFMPFHGYSRGWFCKKVIEMAIDKDIDFTITRKYIPHAKNIIPKDHFTAFVKYVYNSTFTHSEELGAKVIINSFIGQLGCFHSDQKISRVNHIVNSVVDVEYYKLKGMEQYILRGGDNPLYMVSSTTKAVEQAEHSLSIHSQILQEAKCRLQELNDSIIWTEEGTNTITEPNLLSYIRWKWTFSKREPIQTPEALEVAYKRYVDSHSTTEHTYKILAYPLMYKTDSITLCDYNEGNLDQALADLAFGDERGKIRVEGRWNGATDTDKLLDILTRRFRITRREKLTPEEQTKRTTHYTKEAYISLLDNGEGFRLDGMAGTGKSSLTCGGHGLTGILPHLDEMKLKGEKVGYAMTATTNKARANKLFIDKGFIGETLHKFLGVGGSGSPRDSKFKHIGTLCAEVDYFYIIIDECSMISQGFYGYLHRIKTLYPKVRYILIGDYQQLPAVITDEDRARCAIYQPVDTKLIEWLCDYNSIKLTENMRSSADGKALWKLYNNIIDHPYHKWNKEDKAYLNAMRTENKFGKNQVIGQVNLCRSQATKNAINKNCVAKIVEWLGQENEVVRECPPFKNDSKKTIKSTYITHIWKTIKHRKCKVVSISNGEGFYNNQEFIVLNYTDSIIHLKDITTEEEIDIGYTDLYKRFDYCYAMTIHRSQGSTISEKYTINDWDDIPNNAEGRALKYVAISRCSSSDFPIINGSCRYDPIK